VAVTQLDQMTQQNAALVEQSAAAAESLKDQASRLAQVIQIFRMDSNASAVVVAPRALPAPGRTASTPKAHAPKALASPARAALPGPEPKRLPVAKPVAASAPAAAAAPKPVAVRPAKVPSASTEGDWESF
jgi:methyl-accepting chemotaxis protein